MSTTACMPVNVAAARPAFTPWVANALANGLTRVAERLRAMGQPVAGSASAGSLGARGCEDWMALSGLSPGTLKDIGAPAWLLAQVSARRDPGLDVAAWR